MRGRIALDDALRASTVVGLVGSRIGPFSVRPQAEGLPAITVQKIGGERIRSLGGRTGLVPATFQVNCMGRTYAEAAELADVVRLAIDATSGVHAGVKVHSIHVFDDSDDFEPPRSGFEREDSVPFVPLTVRIWFTEATA